MKLYSKNTLLQGLLSASVLSLTACGGGGGSDSTQPTEEMSHVAVTGEVTKGLVLGGIVNVFPIVDGIISDVPMATTETDKTTGGFTLNVDIPVTNSVAVFVTGRPETDPEYPAHMVCDVLPNCGEGTSFGQPMALPADFMLRAVLPTIGEETAISVNVTPLTDIAAEYALNNVGPSADNIAAANSQIANLFQLNGELTNFSSVDITNAASLAAASSSAQKNALFASAIMGIAIDNNNGDIFEALNDISVDIGQNDGQLVISSGEGNVVTLADILSRTVALASEIDEGHELGSVLSELQTFSASSSATEHSFVTRMLPSPTTPMADRDSLSKSDRKAQRAKDRKAKRELRKVKGLVDDIRTLGTVATYDDLETGAEDFAEELEAAGELIKDDTDEVVKILEVVGSALKDAWEQRENATPSTRTITTNEEIGRIRVSIFDENNGGYRFKINQKTKNGFRVKINATALKDDDSPYVNLTGSIQNNVVRFDITEGSSDLEKGSKQKDASLHLTVSLTKKKAVTGEKAKFTGQFNLDLVGVDYNKKDGMTFEEFCDQFSFYTCDQWIYDLGCDYGFIECGEAEWGTFESASLLMSGTFEVGRKESFSASFALNLYGQGTIIGNPESGTVFEDRVDYVIAGDAFTINMPGNDSEVFTYFETIDDVKAVHPLMYDPGIDGPFVVRQTLVDGVPLEIDGFIGPNIRLYSAYDWSYPYMYGWLPEEDMPVVTDIFSAIQALIDTSSLWVGFLEDDNYYSIVFPASLTEPSGNLDATLSGSQSRRGNSIFEYGDTFIDFSFTLQLKAKLKSLSKETQVILSGERNDIDSASASLEVAYEGHRVKLVSESISLEGDGLVDGAPIYVSNQDGVTGILWDDPIDGIKGSFAINGNEHATVSERENGMVFVEYSDLTFDTFE